MPAEYPQVKSRLQAQVQEAIARVQPTGWSATLGSDARNVKRKEEKAADEYKQNGFALKEGFKRAFAALVADYQSLDTIDRNPKDLQNGYRELMGMIAPLKDELILKQQDIDDWKQVSTREVDKILFANELEQLDLVFNLLQETPLDHENFQAIWNKFQRLHSKISGQMTSEQRAHYAQTYEALAHLDTINQSLEALRKQKNEIFSTVVNKINQGVPPLINADSTSDELKNAAERAGVSIHITVDALAALGKENDISIDLTDYNRYLDAVEELLNVAKVKDYQHHDDRVHEKAEPFLADIVGMMRSATQALNSSVDEVDEGILIRSHTLAQMTSRTPLETKNKEVAEEFHEVRRAARDALSQDEVIFARLEVRYDTPYSAEDKQLFLEKLRDPRWLADNVPKLSDEQIANLLRSNPTAAIIEIERRREGRVTHGEVLDDFVTAIQRAADTAQDEKAFPDRNELAAILHDFVYGKEYEEDSDLEREAEAKKAADAQPYNPEHLKKLPKELQNLIIEIADAKPLADSQKDKFIRDLLLGIGSLYNNFREKSDSKAQRTDSLDDNLSALGPIYMAIARSDNASPLFALRGKGLGLHDIAGNDEVASRLLIAALNSSGLDDQLPRLAPLADAKQLQVATSNLFRKKDHIKLNALFDAIPDGEKIARLKKFDPNVQHHLLAAYIHGDVARTANPRLKQELSQMAMRSYLEEMRVTLSSAIPPEEKLQKGSAITIEDGFPREFPLVNAFGLDQRANHFALLMDKRISGKNLGKEFIDELKALNISTLNRESAALYGRVFYEIVTNPENIIAMSTDDLAALNKKMHELAVGDKWLDPGRDKWFGAKPIFRDMIAGITSLLGGEDKSLDRFNFEAVAILNLYLRIQEFPPEKRARYEKEIVERIRAEAKVFAEEKPLLGPSGPYFKLCNDPLYGAGFSNLFFRAIHDVDMFKADAGKDKLPDEYKKAILSHVTEIAKPDAWKITELAAADIKMLKTSTRVAFFGSALLTVQNALDQDQLKALANDFTADNWSDIFAKWGSTVPDKNILLFVLADPTAVSGMREAKGEKGAENYEQSDYEKFLTVSFLEKLEPEEIAAIDIRVRTRMLADRDFLRDLQNAFHTLELPHLQAFVSGLRQEDATRILKDFNPSSEAKVIEMQSLDGINRFGVRLIFNERPQEVVDNILAGDPIIGKKLAANILHELSGGKWGAKEERDKICKQFKKAQGAGRDMAELVGLSSERSIQDYVAPLVNLVLKKPDGTFDPEALREIKPDVFLLHAIKKNWQALMKSKDVKVFEALFQNQALLKALCGAGSPGDPQLSDAVEAARKCGFTPQDFHRALNGLRETEATANQGNIVSHQFLNCFPIYFENLDNSILTTQQKKYAAILVLAASTPPGVNLVAAEEKDCRVIFRNIEHLYNAEENKVKKQVIVDALFHNNRLAANMVFGLAAGNKDPFLKKAMMDKVAHTPKEDLRAQLYGYQRGDFQQAFAQVIDVCQKELANKSGAKGKAKELAALIAPIMLKNKWDKRCDQGGVTGFLWNIAYGIRFLGGLISPAKEIKKHEAAVELMERVKVNNIVSPMRPEAKATVAPGQNGSTGKLFKAADMKEVKEVKAVKEQKTGIRKPLQAISRSLLSRPKVVLTAQPEVKAAIAKTGAAVHRAIVETQKIVERKREGVLDRELKGDAMHLPPNVQSKLDAEQKKIIGNLSVAIQMGEASESKIHRQAEYEGGLLAKVFAKAKEMFDGPNLERLLTARPEAAIIMIVDLQHAFDNALKQYLQVYKDQQRVQDVKQMGADILNAGGALLERMIPGATPGMLRMDVERMPDLKKDKFLMDLIAQKDALDQAVVELAKVPQYQIAMTLAQDVREKERQTRALVQEIKRTTPQGPVELKSAVARANQQKRMKAKPEAYKAVADRLDKLNKKKRGLVVRVKKVFTSPKKVAALAKRIQQRRTDMAIILRHTSNASVEGFRHSLMGRIKGPLKARLNVARPSDSAPEMKHRSPRATF